MELVRHENGSQITDTRSIQAIEVWEKGALKEKQGSMTDAIKFYRQALKLHENVEQLYRKKIQDDWNLQKQLEQLKIAENRNLNDLNTDTEEVEKEENISEEVELEPCWLFEMLSDELLARIVKETVLLSGTSWLNLSLTCKKFNQLCFYNSIAFKAFASYIYSRQSYENNNLAANLGAKWGYNYQKMLLERPYIYFEGIYISTVNYLRYGANAEGSSSLLNPIHMITYYRYFRFYPDGFCLRLLTTTEPMHVVKSFSRNNAPKDAHLCKWCLKSIDGTLRLIICRQSEKYSFIEQFHLRNHAHRRHQKLKWHKSEVIDRNDDIFSCSLKNEKPFFFSRVKSYTGHH